MVAEKHWHLQIRYYAANTLFASLKFIHSNLRLDDLADPFSIGNTCAKHFKTERGSVVSFWMTYKNDVIVGIKRERSHAQESISRDFKGWFAILMWLCWAYFDNWIKLAWYSPNTALTEMIKDQVVSMRFDSFAKARTYPLSTYPTMEEQPMCLLCEYFLPSVAGKVKYTSQRSVKWFQEMLLCQTKPWPCYVLLTSMTE